MVRANDPPSIEASRTVTGTFFVAIIDFILLALVLMWLIFVCGQGTVPAGAVTSLTLLHGVHLIIIVSACVVFPLDVLFIPFWFIIVALAVASVDVFVLVSRASTLFGGNVFSFGCDFFMFFFDVVFLLFAIMYLAFAARSTSWYGSLGDTDLAEDPFIGQEPEAITEPERFTPDERRIDVGGAVAEAAAQMHSSAAHKKDDDATVPLLSGSDMFGLPTHPPQSAAQRRQKLKQVASSKNR